MAHIILQGCNMTKSIQMMQLHLRITFKNENHSIKNKSHLLDFEQKLSDFIKDYYDYCESEILTDNEYNQHQ